MCNQNTTLHSCGHQGPVNTNLGKYATRRLNQALRNIEAATFDAACDVRPETINRDYCCDRKFCSQPIKITYDAYQKAGAAKCDFPAPSFMQRSMTGKPKPSYLAKKEEVKAAYLQAQADHDASKRKHAACRVKQDEPVLKGAPSQEKEKIASNRQLEQQRLERAMRRRFGEVPEPDARKDSYFPLMPPASSYEIERPTQRRPPPPRPIMAYGPPQEGHEYVREWLPRIGLGRWSGHSRGGQCGQCGSTMNASGSNDLATRNSYGAPPVVASKDPFADEYAGCISNGPGVIRPRYD